MIIWKDDSFILGINWCLKDRGNFAAKTQILEVHRLKGHADSWKWIVKPEISEKTNFLMMLLFTSCDSCIYLEQK